MAEDFLFDLIRKHNKGSMGLKVILEDLKREAGVNNFPDIVPALYNALKEAYPFMENEKALQIRIEELEKENQRLKETIDQHETIMNTYNSYQLQKSKLKSGVKIAYKEDVTIDKIKEAYNRLGSYELVANELGVSRTTIYRRLNPGNK
ncbi:MAG: hypothetical protein GX288_12505 [Clostridiales bacterium]|nr:hypothetical protein [Clostridiales bacterium]